MKGICGALLVACCLLVGAASPALATTGSADLSVTKSDSPDPVTADSDITYTVTVHNAGPDSSQGVQLSDPIPANTTFSSASVSQGTVAFNANTITASFGTIASGNNATLRLTVHVTAGTPPGTVIGNAAAAWSTTTGDPDHTNNVAAAPTVVGPVTLVEVRSFTAVRKAGIVTVRWVSSGLLQVAGFNVYRDTVWLNRGLIVEPGAANAYFMLVDRRAPRGRRLSYWLEVVR